MNSTTTTAPIDPSTRLALANLCAHLAAEGDFSPRAITAILDYAREEGTVHGAPYLYDAEADALTEVFVRGFEPVDQADPSWGSAEGHEHMLNPLDDVCSIEPCDVPDAPDYLVTRRPGYREALERDGILPAIAGGCEPSDTGPEYIPTDEDLEEYARWSRDLDGGDVETPPAPSRYSPEALAAFRRAAWGV